MNGVTKMGREFIITFGKKGDRRVLTSGKGKRRRIRTFSKKNLASKTLVILKRKGVRNPRISKRTF